MTTWLLVTFGASRRGVGFGINSYRGVVFLQFLGCSVIYMLYGGSVIAVCLYRVCLYNTQPARVSVYFYVPDHREDQRHVLVLRMWILAKIRQETAQILLVVLRMIMKEMGRF